MDELDIRGVRTRVWKNAPPSLCAVWERTERFVRTYVVYVGGAVLAASESARSSTRRVMM